MYWLQAFIPIDSNNNIFIYKIQQKTKLKRHGQV